MFPKKYGHAKDGRPLTDFSEASDMSPMAAAAPRRAMVVAGVAVKQLAAASFFGGHRRARVGDQDTT